MGRVERTENNIFPIPSGVTISHGYVYMNISNATLNTSSGKICSNHVKVCIGKTVVGPNGDWKKDRRMYANQNYREMQFTLSRLLKDKEKVSSGEEEAKTDDSEAENLSPGVRKLLKQITDKSSAEKVKENVARMYPQLYWRNQGTSVSFGVYLAVHKMAADSGLLAILEEAFGVDEALLILDLALYGIVTGKQVYQHFPDYAWQHAIFSDVIRSDSYISNFLTRGLPLSKINYFRYLWACHIIEQGGELYFCYDSTNVNSSSTGMGVSLVERGHAKDNKGKPQINTDYVIRQRDGIPVTFTTFPGSIPDSGEASKMFDFFGALLKNEYSEAGESSAEKMFSDNDIKDIVSKVLFICDRGYISEDNVAELDRQNLDFLLLIRGDMNISRKLIEENYISLRSLKYYIDDPNYKSGSASGITVTGYLYNDTSKLRYFHIIYDSDLESNHRAAVMNRKDCLQKDLDSAVKEQTPLSKIDVQRLSEFFDLTTEAAPSLENKSGGRGRKWPVIVTGYQLNCEKLDHALWQCGCFVLVSSRKMTAAEALIAYRKSDIAEKSFMTLKSFLGMDCFGVHSDEAINAKSLIWFVAVTLHALLFHATSALRKEAVNKNQYTMPSMIASLAKVQATLDARANQYASLYKLPKRLRVLFESIGITEEDVYEYPSSIEAKVQFVNEYDEEEEEEENENVIC